MLSRLRDGHRERQDLRFYEHELHEQRMMAAGLDSRAAHLAALDQQGIAYEPGYERLLYHPSVIAALREYFNPAAHP